MKTINRASLLCQRHATSQNFDVVVEKCQAGALLCGLGSAGAVPRVMRALHKVGSVRYSTPPRVCAAVQGPRHRVAIVKMDRLTRSEEPRVIEALLGCHWYFLRHEDILVMPSRIRECQRHSTVAQPVLARLRVSGDLVLVQMRFCLFQAMCAVKLNSSPLSIFRACWSPRETHTIATANPTIAVMEMADQRTCLPQIL